MFIITHTSRRKGAQRHIWKRCRTADEAVKELRSIIDGGLVKYDYAVYTGDWIKQADLKITINSDNHVVVDYTCNNPVLDLEADYE